ncbi:MAG: HEPN domain-containing protein [Defluviitaleaceae bacterium]|nr:HEPN domain-containing protein [Defluviitaleaceae bacterium]
MDSGSAMELAGYRLGQAKDCLKAAENNMQAGLYKDALNRSYYCIFHSIRAVLALESFDSTKHSGIISEFHKSFIKTGKFDKRFSATIRQSFQVRNRSDYEDFYIVSKDEVIQQISNATDFMQAVTEYLTPPPPQ